MTQEQYYWYVLRPRMLANAMRGNAVGGNSGNREPEPEEENTIDFYFRSEENENKITLNKENNFTNTISIDYVITDAKKANPWEGATPSQVELNKSITLNKNQYLYMRASKDYTNDFRYKGGIGEICKGIYVLMTKKAGAYGDIKRLINQDAANTSCYFAYFFNECSCLTHAPLLSATELTDNCYNRMFQGCTSLTSAPELPATTLADDCYSAMFNGCTSLSSAPELPATTLCSDCYCGMFQGCTSLSSAPELSALTLAKSCYYAMFQGCTSLTSAPALSATNLSSNCYALMFKSCSSLNSITVSFTSWGNNNNEYTQNWVNGVAENGNFYCPSDLAQTSSFHNIPNNWTVNTSN